MVPVSPFWSGREKSIKDIFVPIQLNRVAIEKNGSRRETEQKVDTYKDMFYKDNTLSDRVSIQGNPGMGKTTFLAKLVLDWCDTVSSKDPGPSSCFGDLETLHNFRFVLHIKLRDSIGQCKVVEMIKTQIIDEIYHNELQKMEAYDLLGSIMERETCLVTLDGLNEWTDSTKENPMPKMYSLCKRCVVLLTSRPWKMADKRIRDSEIGTLLEVVRITDPEQLTHNMLCSLTTDDELAYIEFMTYVEERNLKHFLTSPWMLTLLVNLWVDKSFLSGSLCEINKVLIKTLFNKGLAKEEFEDPSPFEHSLFGHHTEIGNALAKVAFKYTIGSEKSLVLSKNVLISSEMLSIEQLEFAIKCGVLNERHCYSTASSKSYVSFLHETVQEFFAASYIGNLPEDTITALFSKSHDNLLEISQVIIYLSGLMCDVANKVINHLTEDVLSNVNEGLDRLITWSYDKTTYITFQETVVNTKTKLKSNLNINLSSDLRGLVLSILVQDMIVTCYHEAKVSRQKHIRMNMSDFTFHAYLNTNTYDDLLQLLMMNKSNVRTLLLERHALPEKHILTVLQHSKHSMERLKTLGSHSIISELQNMNLKQLSLIGNIDVTLFFGLLPSLGNLTFLRIEEFDFHEDIFLPSTLRYLCLLKSRCSAEFVGRLLVHLSQVSQLVRFNLGEVYTTENTDLYIAKLRSRIKACDMSKLSLCFGKDASQLFKILNASNLGEITFETADVFLSASKHLHTLNKLKEICLAGTYMGSWNCRLPKMLQYIQLIYCEFSIEWLCSLLITLSLLDHPAQFWLADCVMQSGKETFEDDSHTYVSEIRSKMLSTDLSNIELKVTTGSLELFSILRDSSIGILGLETTECASLASEILHTLKRLTKLYLRGTYTGRCDLKLPALLQRISMQTCECSYEWLCSLFIALSSLDHPVRCELVDVQLKSIEVYHGDESHTRVSDMRSELLSHNLSNIEICVQNGSKELFEILRDTSIGILDLKTTDCASLASEILHTLSSLTKLYLWGTYTGRFDLKLPALLQCISMEKCECSSEWLCSLFITLSSLDRPVRCELGDVQLRSIEVNHRDESHTRVSDMRSELLSHNLSNIEICVQNGSKELFEILRDTSIGILDLRTTDCASLASEILHTLSSLTKLYLWGTYTGRFDLKLPALLQCISMEKCECSSEWLCSLFITLSSLDRPVRCELGDVQLMSIEVNHRDESHTRVSDMRSELLSHNLSNIEICVQNGSKKLFEILRDTSIGILDLRTTDCASLASEILHTLSSLTKLYLWGTYTGRFDLKLPALLQCISMEKCECSSEWLCSLFITLSSLDRPVRCELGDVQLRSIEVNHRDESHTRVSDMRSELLSHNLSNIEICVQNGSKELFEILRDTSIGILDLRTTDCASLASVIHHTLSSLTKLYLWGTFTGRFDLKLPALLQCISMEKCECSSEWLCSLFITLYSLDRPVRCELGDVQLRSIEVNHRDESHTPVSDMRSELLSHNLSNIEICVQNGSKELFEILRDTSIGILDLRTTDCASLASEILHTLSSLTKLYLWGTYTGRFNLKLPALLQCISMEKCECSSEWLCSLFITLSSLDRPVRCELGDVQLRSIEVNHRDESHTRVSDMRSELLSHNLSNIEICVQNGSKELFEILRDTSIGILDLRTTDCASLASENLHTLSSLTKLYLWGTYTGRFDLKLPALFQCISIQKCECSSEWLCSLFITLSSLDHPVRCDLWDVQLKSIEVYHGDESHTRVSDMRSELLSHNLSNIEICVQNGSKELFEILRDTRLEILILRTTGCASLPSEILHTLSSLTKLHLTGTYTGRCNLKLPALLQGISMQTCECSSEWLCSLFIALSSLDRPVRCQLWDVQLQSIEVYHGDESHTRVSDMRSDLLSHNLSNIEICVHNGSKELFEILRDTRLGILILKTTGCASLPSEILHTLSSLTKLYLWGTYTGRFDLKLPALLQCISMQKCECSSEWLCSLFFTLSSLDRPVRCELGDVQLRSIEVNHGDESHTRVSDMRSELLSHNLSNIEIFVQNGSKELFEILRDTSIGILDLRTTDCVSLASKILHTLSSLTKLYLWGTYTGRFDLKLPALFQCISIQKCKCSSEWLCSLFIALSSLDHPVRCQLWDVQLKSIEVYHGDESHTRVSDMRSELLSHNLSNIEICVQNGSKELFEILRDTSIGILDLRTTDCASLASAILHTLSSLTKLYLTGTYTGRFDLKLPALLQCISMEKCECSSEWLCSLFITLSSLDRPVRCELGDVQLRSIEVNHRDESHTRVSDMRSELLSHNLSNIEICVQNGSKELFEILRDTSIGILDLRTTDCASLASEILHTLSSLTKLFLRGTYTGRCNLKLPALLQGITMQTCECSSEWLCSLFIALSSLDRPVRCQLWDVQLQSIEVYHGDESHTRVSDMRSELLSHNLSNIKICVKNGSKELFEILRDTRFGILILRTTGCASLPSEILHTLSSLTKLYLRGTYTGRCHLKLPALFQCISIQKCKCSSEWLCSLFIALSSLDHPVRCQLWDVQLKSIEVYHGDESHTRVSDMRSELLSHNLSNIEICVQNGSKELFEILRDTTIGILDLRTTDCASLASAILHTLSSLTKLYLTGTYTGRFDLKLPALLQCISMEKCECSSEWLCSLFITLSSLDRPVRCELGDVQLRSIEVNHRDESHTRVSDMRSELLSHNLSNIEICVQNGSKELFKILRDSSIGILGLETTECASLASEILHTLKRLTKLYLRGTYTGRCDLKLPALLQRISMQTCEC
ncbi:hypothetical protein DPMN_186829 [Dreissena polymorpha]|uniref:NACHT domain-containing protein n=1 Tax=Dreissena polymorpha TaxID=45954 RepID=A0A9D4I6W5_DREPO|nr:hypothetical protein DPMN_186829 [Dreissena polymorpha]